MYTLNFGISYSNLQQVASFHIIPSIRARAGVFLSRLKDPPHCLTANLRAQHPNQNDTPFIEALLVSTASGIFRFSHMIATSEQAERSRFLSSSLGTSWAGSWCYRTRDVLADVCRQRNSISVGPQRHVRQIGDASQHDPDGF